MRAYSQNLRDRVLGALERGEGPSAIAERYEVSRLWVYQVRRRWQEQGLRHKLPSGGIDAHALRTKKCRYDSG